MFFGSIFCFCFVFEIGWVIEGAPVVRAGFKILAALREDLRQFSMGKVRSKQEQSIGMLCMGRYKAMSEGVMGVSSGWGDGGAAPVVKSS